MKSDPWADSIAIATAIAIPIPIAIPRKGRSRWRGLENKQRGLRGITGQHYLEDIFVHFVKRE